MAGPFVVPNDAVAAVPIASSLETLLGAFDQAKQLDAHELTRQDQFVEARLGVASALFTALRAKHGPTAHHCLRVAIRCSVLARQLDLSREEIDCLGIAALLHDVGKVGVPDHLLTKPGPLDEEELEIMGRQRGCGIRILETCTSDSQILDILRYSACRFDGFARNVDLRGREMPVGARILAVIDAFDAMTTDHVYRPAMSRERALAELFHFAGSQFDPDIVKQFADHSTLIESQLESDISRVWSPGTGSDMYWRLQQPIGDDNDANPLSSFQAQLLGAMNDGVIFVDVSGRIMLWNPAAEQLTGITAQSVIEKVWNGGVLGLRDVEGNTLRDERCPLAQSLRSRTGVTLHGSILQPNQHRLVIELQVIPVMSRRRRVFHGVTMLIRDLSSETRLRARVQDLRELAMTDPLTGVSNRAAFDLGLKGMIGGCLTDETTCSIIIADVDHFKQVNDVFGHQAGDQVLIQFAAILERCSRQTDSVARFGGEEFVILCPDCDNAAATRRAERIRREVSLATHECIGFESITASFGVTELQLGDDPETMLRRADRALYQAKDAGRNRVVQLGTGLVLDTASGKRNWLSWFRRRPTDCLVERTLIARVPLNVLAEKIRGFIADHDAHIISIDENEVVLSLDDQGMPGQRRTSDRPVMLIVEMTLCEQNDDPERPETQSGSVIDVKIRPRKRVRDRRSTAQSDAEQILASIRSYLIAQDL